MNETTAQPLTRDDVRAIVGEEIGKLGGLLATTSGFTGSTGQGLKFDDGANEVPDRVPEYGRLVSSIFIESFFEAVKHGATDGVALRKVEIVKLSGHGTSPSVDAAGAHSVGDGLGAGDASATPATEVTEDSLHTRLTFSQIDESKAEEIYRAAQANVADAAENLAHARNRTRDAETALNDFTNGSVK